MARFRKALAQSRAKETPSALEIRAKNAQRGTDRTGLWYRRYNCAHDLVNPHSIAAMKNFWVDLSHQKPIFPEVAVTLCRPHNKTVRSGRERFSLGWQRKSFGFHNGGT